MADVGELLSTDHVLCRSQQYDPAVVFHADLSKLKLKSMPASALAPCLTLTVVNLSKNRLASLAGLEAIGSTLQYLDASENEISDITALKSCTVLCRVALQGNQLRDLQALQPLKVVSTLRELTLRAEITLDGDPEPLVLDNPLCGQKKADYVEKCTAALPQLQWLDASLLSPNPFRHACKTITGGSDATCSAKEKASSCNEELRQLTAATVGEKSSNEVALEKLLAAAKSL